MLLTAVEEPAEKYNPNFESLKAILHNPDRAKLLDTTSIPPLMLNESLDSANSNPSQKLEHSPPGLSEDKNKVITDRGINSQHGNNYELLEVKGPEGQVCESKRVLDSILTKYTHISSNTFKGFINSFHFGCLTVSSGGATGKIKAEYMICDCKYDHCNSFSSNWTYFL